MITTVYSLFWDIYVDWGLFRGTKGSNRILRNDIMFKPVIYYLAIFMDTALRFWWLLAFA